MGDLGGMYAALMGQVGNDMARTTQVGMQVGAMQQESNNQLVNAIRQNRARMDALKQQERDNALKERGMSLEETLGQGKLGLMGAQTSGLKQDQEFASQLQPGKKSLQDLEIGGKKLGNEAGEVELGVAKATAGDRSKAPGIANENIRSMTGLHNEQARGAKIGNDLDEKYGAKKIESMLNVNSAQAAAARASAGLSGAHAEMVNEQVKQLRENGDPKSFGVVMKSYEDLLSAWKAEGTIAAQTGLPFTKPMPSADDARDHLAALRGENKAHHNGQPFTFDSEVQTPAGPGRVYRDGAGNVLLVPPGGGQKRFIPAGQAAAGVSSNSPQGLPPAAYKPFSLQLRPELVAPSAGEAPATLPNGLNEFLSREQAPSMMNPPNPYRGPRTF